MTNRIATTIRINMFKQVNVTVVRSGDDNDGLILKILIGVTK